MMKRTYCGLVNENQLNQEVLIKGWVKKTRKLGKLLFINVADRSGLVQVVLDDANQYFATALDLKRESVVEIKGLVKLRKEPNLELKTGKFEIDLIDLKIDSVSLTPPLIIEDNTDALEDVRMDYRFLDLRRPIMQRNLFFRSKVINAIREFLVDREFIDVETPILGKPTPEGARDYLVPSRVHPTKFYALPQSPQIYKQLLMCSGFDKYFQIAKCFRDEDLRSDRQPEFTQLDMEMSFIEEIDIQTVIEELLASVFKKTMNVDVKIPFIRMDYHQAMNEYGSDKPDLRFGLKLHDVTDYFSQSKLSIFANAKQNNHVIKAIICDQILDKKLVHELEKYAKDMQAKGLAWVSLSDGNMTGSVANHLEVNEISNLLKQHNLTQGTILFVVDKLEIVNTSLGLVRNVLAEKLGLKDPNQFSFLWVVNWPLFELDQETNQYMPAHHPFTQPQNAFHNDFDTNKANALAKAYDVVLNGYELGGGSIRITNPDMQNRMFKALGMSESEINNKFGYLIEAFRYGVPPHGGLAIGVDRLLAIMLGLSNIKDVIAFPKNNKAFDQMLKAPSPVNHEDINNLGLEIIKK